MFSSDTPVTCKGLGGCRGGGRLVIVCHGCLCMEGVGFCLVAEPDGRPKALRVDSLSPAFSFSALFFDSLQLCFILSRQTCVWIHSITQQRHCTSYKRMINKLQLKNHQLETPLPSLLTAVATENLFHFIILTCICSYSCCRF